MLTAIDVPYRNQQTDVWRSIQSFHYIAALYSILIETNVSDQATPK